jgi:hypothetical protein
MAAGTKLPLAGRNWDRIELELNRVLGSKYLLLPSRYADPLIGNIVAMETHVDGIKNIINFGETITIVKT